MDYPYQADEDVFPVRVDGEHGSLTFVEQVPGVDGVYTDAYGARRGEIAEVNGRPVATPLYALARLRLVQGGTPIYEFFADNSPEWIKCTGAAADASGTYPGVLQRWDRPAAGDPPAWRSTGQVVRLLPASGESVEVGRRYLGTPAGVRNADGLAVYIAAITCCSGYTPPTPATGCYCADAGAKTYCVTLPDDLFYSVPPTPAEETRCVSLRGSHTLAYSGTQDGGSGNTICLWRWDSLATDSSITLSVDGYGNATLAIVRKPGPYSAGSITYYALKAGTFNCTGSNVFVRNPAEPQACLYLPEELTVTYGPCSTTPPSGCCPDTAEWCLDLDLSPACSDGEQEYSLAYSADCTWEATGADGWTGLFDPSIAYLEIYFNGDPIAGYSGEPVTDCDGEVELVLDYAADASCEFPASITLAPGGCGGGGPPAGGYCFPGANFGICGSFDPATLTSSGPNVWSWTDGVRDVTLTVTGGTAELVVYDGGVDATYTCASWDPVTGGTFGSVTGVPPCDYPTPIVITGGACS